MTDELEGLSFEMYVGMAESSLRLHPNWRKGQAFFNMLARVRPDLSEQIRATPLDPFHRSDVLPNMLAWVAERWEGDVTIPDACKECGGITSHVFGCSEMDKAR